MPILTDEKRDNVQSILDRRRERLAFARDMRRAACDAILDARRQRLAQDGPRDSQWGGGAIGEAVGEALGTRLGYSSPEAQRSATTGS